MATLYITVGLPASGKTTWSAEQAASRRPGAIVHLTKDKLRDMLHFGVHTPKREGQVIAARDALIAAFLADGVDVIVDDTNLNPVHGDRLCALADEHGAEVVTVDFTNVDVDECVARDAKRAEHVGEAVIRGMYRRWLAPRAPGAPAPDDAPEAVLVDIDGTLALMDGRSPFAWDKVSSDRPNTPVVELVRQLAAVGTRIIIMSGRDGKAREATISWLAEHLDVEHELHMRAEGDSRKDHVVKREMYDAHVAGRYRVRFVLDDRDQVVRLWRDELGLACFQVAWGDF